MLLCVLNILFVIGASSIVVLILMQRGTGAAAGSGFGGGASSTVFGARGSASFLTKATKWLAITFFAITLAMAWFATRNASLGQMQQDMGIMGSVPTVPQAPVADPTVPQAPEITAPAEEGSVPAVPQAPAEGSEQETEGN